MLRNNCYLPKPEKKKWSWTGNSDFIKDYWREGVRRGEGRDILWTVGMRGIHDGRMPDGKTAKDKIEILEEVFAAQCGMLPDGAPTVFCPYKEVLPLYNAGLKVPAGTTILWTNDNFGYIRRIGDGKESRQGMYWHLSYWGNPHGYLHLCTTPPAFMWYELVAKCWNNGVRDMWIVNAGDVFQADILLDAFGKFAADPGAWGADAQRRFLEEWSEKSFLTGFTGLTRFENLDGCNSKGPENPVNPATNIAERIANHLAEYYNLGFIRKPEHMCVQWSRALPGSVKSSLLSRYRAFLKEDAAIEESLANLRVSASLREKTCDAYFRLVGFQARFLAHAGIIHLEGRDRAYAKSVIDPLYGRWNKLEGGKWSGFWADTIDEKGGNRWSSQMQWPWNVPADSAKKDRRGRSRSDYAATAYRADIPEPAWLEPRAAYAANGGAWTAVEGLGTSGNALALLPVKPGVGKGAAVEFSLTGSNPVRKLVLQFLPDFALWPGLKLGVEVAFDGGEAQYVEVPGGDSNTGEFDKIRNMAVQDNFVRVEVPVPAGAKCFKVVATDPGVVIDRVGIRSEKYESTK